MQFDRAVILFIEGFLSGFAPTFCGAFLGFILAYWSQGARQKKVYLERLEHAFIEITDDIAEIEALTRQIKERPATLDGDTKTFISVQFPDFPSSVKRILDNDSFIKYAKERNAAEFYRLCNNLDVRYRSVISEPAPSFDALAATLEALVPFYSEIAWKIYALSTQTKIAFNRENYQKLIKALYVEDIENFRLKKIKRL